MRPPKKKLTSSELTELNAATANATATGTYSNWAMRSFFGRVNLNWDEKYLLEANLRADASSRFAKIYRWGYFPSFSLGWRMEQEAFMKDISRLNQLKPGSLVWFVGKQCQKVGANWRLSVILSGF